jgi:hypothetical protein
MMTDSMLRDEFNALEEIYLKETIQEICEGAVVQLLEKKIIST